MATTFVDYTGDGNATKAFSFPSIQQSDIKVTVDEVLKSSGTHYNITSYTTTGGGNVVFTSGNIPASPAAIRIFRDTSVDAAKATYTAGSSVKAEDLNANHKQLLFAVQEEQNIVSSTQTVKGFISAADKVKLDGIETAATADQTAAEIRTLVESATNSNVFTDADHTKLNAIEAGATGDQTNAEIKTAYEANSNTNAFTDAEKTKLSGIEASATGNQSNAEIKTAYEANSNTNAFTDAEKTKLSGIETSATADQTSTEIKSLLASDKLSGADHITDYSIPNSKIVQGSLTGSEHATGFLNNANFITAGGSVGADKVLVYDATEATNWKWATQTGSGGGGGGGGGGLSDIVNDTSPQLGGNLDVQTNEITTSTTNGNVKLNPNGTGVIEIKGSGTGGTLQLNCEANSHGIKLKSPPHSAAASYTLTFPNNVVNGQFLKTDTNGNLSWAAVDLTALSASNLTSGTIPDARFPATLPAVSGANLTNLPASAFNILINTLSSSSGSGGGSATFNGTATRFTLSNAGSNAQAHLVSVNGVIQKPNSGTSPSEGFAIDGNDIIFASAPASGADFFILTIGKAVTIGAPSDDTVTTVKIADDAVTADKLANSINSEIAANTAKTSNATHTGEVTGGTALTIADNVVDEANLKVSNSPTNGYFLSAQSGNTGGLTWAEVSAGVTSDSQDNTVAGTGAGASFSGTDANDNTLFGKNAGNDITTGDNNTALGYQALLDNTSASNNTAIGHNCLAKNTTGTANTGVGRGALVENTTASSNTGVGYFALVNNTTGGNNTAVGKGALDASTTASNNTAVGVDALGLNTTGTVNVAMGKDALQSNTTGSYNTALGKDAVQYNTTADYNTGVGYQALKVNTTGTNNVAVGSNSLDANTTGTNNCAFGNYSLSASTTASGNSSFGYYSGADVTTGANNSSLGRESLRENTTGSENCSIGYQALFKNTTGSYNVVLGGKAAENVIDASQNIAIGYAALQTDCGDECTAIGYNAARYNHSIRLLSIGHYAGKNNNSWPNMFIGYESGGGSADITGSANSACGYQSLRDVTSGMHNAAFGYRANYKNTTGGNNSGFGTYALEKVTTGSHNTGLGYVAGYNITTGNYNTVVGQNVAPDLTTGSNNLLLGHLAGASSSPAGTVSVHSNIVCLGNNSINSLYCADTSISSSDSRDKTDVASFNIGLAWIEALRPVTYRWDRRTWYGTDEQPYGTPDGSKKRDRLHIGFLAQEALEVEKANGYGSSNDNSLICNLTEDGMSYGMKYERLVPILVNAIKELSAKVTALEAG